MKDLCVAEEMKDRFSNDDLAIEILSRLPMESIFELKCVSKRWCALFSSPSFISSQFQKSPSTSSGIFVQGLICCLCCEKYLDHNAVVYLSIGTDGKHGPTRKILEFLPEKVSAVASCFGILLCRNLFEEWLPNHPNDRKIMEIKDYRKKVILYVCNPLTREFITLKPRGKYRNGCGFGFVYSPFGSSSTDPSRSFFSFEVVIVHPPSVIGNAPYRFIIFSSKTGTWRRSKERCNLPYRLHLTRCCSANRVFYWLTTGHSVLAFDLKREISEVIKLPGDELIPDIGWLGMCVGVSEGEVHYICCNMLKLMIWVLKHDHCRVEWVLKHSKPIAEMSHPVIDRVVGWQRFIKTDGHLRPSMIMDPYVLHDDILYLKVHYHMCTYNIKTGMFQELCSFNKFDLSRDHNVVSYNKSLLQVRG